MCAVNKMVTQTSEKEKQSSGPMASWTNTDVVQWLLQIDQKVFVPAVILNNISGKTLMDLSFDKFQSTMNVPKGIPPQDLHSLTSLYNHINALREHRPPGDAEIWGEDKKNEETYGRLLSHPSGWTYEREYNEWIDFFDVYAESAVALHAEATLKKWQVRLQLLILVFSAIATLLTSIQVTGSAAKPKVSNESPPAGSMRIKFGLLLTTFIVTLLAGYVQIKGTEWKEQLASMRQFEVIAEKLKNLYEDNLTHPLSDRLPFKQYQAQVKPLKADIWGDVRLDLSPQQRNEALWAIKKKDPTTWKKVFQVQEVPRKKCCRAAILLSEPEDYTSMLIRFSGEDMGEYTTWPQVFKVDIEQARNAIREANSDSDSDSDSAPAFATNF